LNIVVRTESDNLAATYLLYKNSPTETPVKDLLRVNYRLNRTLIQEKNPQPCLGASLASMVERV